MSMSRLWLFLAVGLPALAAVLAPMSTVDLAYHLRAGTEIIVSGALPTVDTWTVTAAGEPWVNQQWGAQIVLASVHQVGGWTGLVVLRAVLTGVVFGSLAVIARRRGLSTRTTAGLVLAAFAVAAPAMALRPQLFGMACFAVVLVLIADRRAHPSRLWLIPLVTLAWANLHGSFFLAPLALGLAWLEDLHDRVARPHLPLAIALTSAVAACVTPHGPAVWWYAIGLSVNPSVTARITEWQPTSVREVSGLLFFASGFAIVALIARRGERTAWPTLLWLGVFFVIGLYAQRGVAWWPLVAVATIAGVLISPTSDPSRVDPPGVRRLNVVIAGVLVLVGVGLLPAWRPLDPAAGTPVGVLTDAPPGITAALRELVEPGTPVFHPQPWGSWIEYAVPDARTVIDSRIELFPPSVWDDVERVYAGAEGWEDVLVSWGVDVVVVDADQAAFSERLVRDGWVEHHRDDDGAVLVRAGP